MTHCGIYWGGHGCDKEGPHVRHLCGTVDDPCSEVENNQVRYWTDEGWTEWSDCVPFSLDDRILQ